MQKRTVALNDRVPLDLEGHCQKTIFDSEGLEKECHTAKSLPLSEEWFGLEHLVCLRHVCVRVLQGLWEESPGLWEGSEKKGVKKKRDLNL